MSKIKKKNEIELPKSIVGCLYGQPGIGKTTLALSAPKPLLLDTDNGIHRVQSEYRSDVVQVKSYQDIFNNIKTYTNRTYKYYDNIKNLEKSIDDLHDMISQMAALEEDNLKVSAKEFIEEHIELIDNEEFNELFKMCPNNLRLYVADILYQSNIIVMLMDNGVTHIQSSNGTVINNNLLYPYA
jgi:ATP-dependent Lon protease